MARQKWRVLDGRLVFECLVNREPGDGIPSVVDIRCSSSPREMQQVFVTAQAGVFKVRFPCGCYVRGWMRQQTPIHIDDVLCTALFADIHYGCGPDDEHHFEGVIVAVPVHEIPPVPPLPPLPPGPPEPPWPPAPGPDPLPPFPVVNGTSHELFPYLYVRQWPRLAPQAQAWNFIAYVPCSPPSSPFYGDLVVARGQGREAAQDLARHFIDGDSPYQGEFLSRLCMLQGPVQDFALLYERLWRPEMAPEAWCQALLAGVQVLLLEWQEDWAYLDSPAYAEALDRVWQSYFALVVQLGEDPALLEELVRTLMLAHAVARVMPWRQEAGSPPEPPPPLTREQQMALLNATVALTDAVFPLPPAKDMQDVQASPPPASPGWIEPYAIGELQRVHQRLLRYQAGEIARIENVMRGERREIASRHTHRQVEQTVQGSSERQLLGNAAEDGRSSLQEQAHQAVAEATLTQQYNKFTNSYGPPTQATLDGSWTQTVQPGATPGVEDAVRFAREILSKTVHRIQRSVHLLRASSHMSQSEDTVSSVIDNTQGNGSLRAVYRWINKVYEACVVNEGQRLMVECMVRRPAAGYIAQEQALCGMDYLRPVPPRRLDIRSFEDIDRGNYARLGALYEVGDLPVPPPAQRFACATLRGGQEQLVALPPGYRACSASVRCLGQPAPTVVVGCRAFPAGGPSSAAMAGEDGSVPVLVAEPDVTLSPPADEPALVTVEISCEPGPHAMDEWRSAVYARLMAGYQRQLEAYRRRSGSGPSADPRSPLACRMIEQRELKRGCVRLLLDRMRQLTGEGTVAPAGSPPSVFEVNEPRYLQFLDEALEWGEMSYAFYASPDPQGLGLGELPLDDEDAQFASFLQAGQARVLLPVRPHRVMAFLYYCSSGMVWPGSDRLAPADPADLALVNDVKHGAVQRPGPRRVGPAWEIVVPTSMQVLDESGGWLGREGPGGDAAAPLAEGAA